MNLRASSVFMGFSLPKNRRKIEAISGLVTDGYRYSTGRFVIDSYKVYYNRHRCHGGLAGLLLNRLNLSNLC
jgi:hypothetical protein